MLKKRSSLSLYFQIKTFHFINTEADPGMAGEKADFGNHLDTIRIMTRKMCKSLNVFFVLRILAKMTYAYRQHEAIVQTKLPCWNIGLPPESETKESRCLGLLGLTVGPTLNEVLELHYESRV